MDFLKLHNLFEIQLYFLIVFMSFLLVGLAKTFIEIRKMIQKRHGSSSNDYFIIIHVFIVVVFYTSYAVMAGFSMRIFNG